MDSQTAIYGRSDDLIKVDGSVQAELVAEFGEPTYVRVGNWTFAVEFDRDGIWRIEVVDQPDGLGCQHYDPGELDEYRDYSEIVKFNTTDGARVEKIPPADSDTTKISVCIVDGNDLVEREDVEVAIPDGCHVEILSDGTLEKTFKPTDN